MPFRFLNNKEFLGLSQSERISYLQRAMATLKRGNPSEITSPKTKH